MKLMIMAQAAPDSKLRRMPNQGKQNRYVL